MSGMLTREEAARRLGMSVDILDAERRRGNLTYVQRQKGSKVWIPETAIDEYIARMTHAAAPKPQNINTLRKRRAV